MGAGASSDSRPASSRTRSRPASSSNKSEVSMKHSAVSQTHISKQLQTKDSQAPKDLMISYSHSDKEIMAKIKTALEDSGISVWVDVVGLNAGVDFLSKIGQAIIEAKLFISLLSKTSVKSKYCQDELALAYVSDTAIFPITLVKPKELYPLMDTGMKLQLARYQWQSLCDVDQFNTVMTELIQMLKDFLAKECADKDAPQKPLADRPKLEKQKSRMNLNRRRGNNMRQYKDETIDLMPDVFWEKFYTGDKVEWNKFVDNFQFLYKAQLEETFTVDDQAWLVSILHREMEVLDDGILDKASFLGFCTLEGEVFPLWKRVQDQAIESYAMKEVFDMESSVRVEAIENLGRFRSSAVIDALRDLLTDSDANVRAVAAISLARTEANDNLSMKHLIKSLNDKDRLVREAGCLALGHLQSNAAVKKLLHMWRNDVISHVREAAQVALQQIGGEEVDKAMHVTSVLAEEIRQLTAE